jgi:hypothetical protein
MYDKMAGIDNIPNLAFLGFDDGKSRPTLPKVAMHISFGGYEIDRKRTIHQVYKATAEGSYIYDGEEFTVPSEFEVSKPLPVDLFYEIDTWCHDSQTSIAMDLAILTTFPERGVLNLPINGDVFEYPIELLGVQDLDDLTENIREKVYRYKIEAWVPSHLLTTMRKIITAPIIELYAKDKKIEEVTLTPDM